MPLPVWYLKRVHVAVGKNPGRKITLDMRDQFVACIGMNAIAASQRGEAFMVPEEQLEAIAQADKGCAA